MCNCAWECLLVLDNNSWSHVQGIIYHPAKTPCLLQLDAHVRPITAISVAPESAYMMTAAQDGRFVVFKLHTRKPSAYQVWITLTLYNRCNLGRVPLLGRSRRGNDCRMSVHDRKRKRSSSCLLWFLRFEDLQDCKTTSCSITCCNEITSWNIITLCQECKIR